MCGIVGILNRNSQKPIDLNLLNRMTKIISHRGPDDSGLFSSGSVGLGHRRLSIIDLESGQQPMTDKVRGRTLIYNGEIYNYRELRQELIKKGFTFKTNCDTEVLLSLADLSSLDWLEPINGMFAFALWDKSSETLLLGRDRLGIKPLYYSILKDEFLFTSDIKSLLLHPKMKREINIERIPEYLAFRNICGSETMFKGIFELPPGHVMLFPQRDFSPQIIKYWEDNNNKRYFDFIDPKDSFEDQFKKILLDSVKYRLISDVPVGTYNSGGVDSSLITAMVRSLTQGELHTFSVGFEECSHDERKYAQIIADKLETNHHTFVINEQTFVDTLQEALWHHEEPISRPSTIPLLLLSRLAKQYVTVVLTGEGADEVFAGYPRLQIPFLAKYLSYLPSIISKGMLYLFNNAGKRRLTKLFENAHNLKQSFIENSRFTPKSDLNLLFNGSYNFSELENIFDMAKSKSTTLIESLLYYDRKTYLPPLLNRLDSTSMAASVEARVSFLDHRLVEWSHTLPQEKKIKIGRANKVIVKKIAEEWLPHHAIYRRKMGFDVPIALWLRNKKGLGQYFSILTDQTFKDRELFDNTSIERLINEHIREEVDHNEILWGLLNLELWCRMFIDNNEFSPKPVF